MLDKYWEQYVDPETGELTINSPIDTETAADYLSTLSSVIKGIKDKQESILNEYRHDIMALQAMKKRAEEKYDERIRKFTTMAEGVCETYSIKKHSALTGSFQWSPLRSKLITTEFENLEKHQQFEFAANHPDFFDIKIKKSEIMKHLKSSDNLGTFRTTTPPSAFNFRVKN